MHLWQPKYSYGAKPNTARRLAFEYFERFPKDRYMTEVESWREIRSSNIEFTMKRLRDPIDSGG